jgi:glycerophosphoryl diester phosphodiesterase
MRAILGLLLLAACAVEPVRPPSPPMAAVPPDLPALFDCLRERGLGLVSAHRGQADPSRAENALASFRETVAAGPILIEVDIRRAADGTLVLMHDDTLDRTTTGTGPVADQTLPALKRLRLADPAGRARDETVPTLGEALAWARTSGAILQLDIKRGVPFAEVVAAVRAAGLSGQVVLIAYNLADVQELVRLAPDMMVSASGRDEAEVAALLAMAADNPRMLGFTGTREPDQALLDRMKAVGMEAITGTLGRPGERLDDRYLADGDGAGYAALIARGVALIASDQPVLAWRALKAAGRDGTICLEGA